MGDTLSDNNISSVFLSVIDTETDAPSIVTSRTTQPSRQVSSIHKHCRPTTKEERARTRKSYFCKYCSSQEDPKGHHTSTEGLRRHLQRFHEIQWSPAENNIRTTPRSIGEGSVQELYENLLERGDAQGLEDEVLKGTLQKDVVKRALLNLIIVRRLPFSCVEWPEFHAFVKALNREAPLFIPIHHSTITDWILEYFVESQDIVRRVLQSAQTNIHLAVDIWTSPSHSLLLGICASFVDIHDEYRNPLIALRPVHSQSGADQWEALRPVLIDYGIDTKIGALVGDNAGSNDVLCRTIGQWLSLEHKITWNATHQRIRCQGHVINLIVQAFLFSSTRDENLMESYDKEDEEPEGEGEDHEEEAAPPISQVVKPKDRRKKKKEDRPEPLFNERGKSIRDMMGPMGKLHNIVVHIRNSANRTTWFKDRAHKIIPLDNRTRWNSWFTMLNVALEDSVRSALQLYVEHYQDDIPKDDIPTTDEWVQLRTIRDFLRSFYEATMFLQGDRTTLEKVLVIIHLLQGKVQTALERADEADDKFMAPRLRRARDKCVTYVQKLDASPYYLAARIFDPEARTGFLKVEDKDGEEKLTAEGEKKVYIVRKLWERFRDKIAPSAVPCASGKLTLQPEGSMTDLQKEIRELKFKSRPQSRDEFDAYISGDQTMLDSSTTAIQWWSQPFQRERFPRLSQLAIEVLSIPGMSDKPERVFSGCRRRVPWDRTKTSPQLLEASECAKDWTAQNILSIPL